MDEAQIIEQTSWPMTRKRIAADLRRLGVRSGMVLLVHSSLSAIGWVPGGPVAVVQALMDVVTPRGTLVMPTHSGDCSDPAEWQNPPVPEAWWPEIREHMPAFDTDLTPTRQMGRIVEVFRTHPDTVRSYHPQVSFAAWGKHARPITDSHSLAYSLGEGSPLARVYELDGWVLLLGVGFGNNTSFHLAEYRLPDPVEKASAGPILEAGRRVWRAYDDVDLDEGPFPQIGADFEGAGEVTAGHIGNAEAKLFRQRAAVDFALSWLSGRRK